MLWRLLIGAGVLVGCTPVPAPEISRAGVYTVGRPYEAGGTWHYPAERFGGQQTGLAVRHPGTRLAADRERWDDTRPVASHPTLQLPSVVRVTNLGTGTSIVVRVIDRGPPEPGRLIGLSAQAADWLGVGQGAVPVRVMVDGLRSQALTDTLAPPTPGLMAAPRAAVLREDLSGRPLVQTASAPAAPDLALPAGPQPGPPEAGRLYLRASTFGQRRYAEMQAQTLQSLRPAITADGQGRAETFTVRAGPYARVADADAALDQARRAGVTDAQIVVE